MKSILLIFGLVFVVLCVQGVIAADERYSGPGWTLIIHNEPIIDPTTGNPYESMGAMIQKENPLYWGSLSPREQNELRSEPAVTTGTSIIGGGCGTEERQARAMELSGQTMTVAEYQAVVNPDLFAIVPESTMDIWRNQKGVVSESGVLQIEGFSSWEFTTDDEGNIIDGGMTPEELMIADMNCPFNTGNGIANPPSSQNAAPTESQMQFLSQQNEVQDIRVELNGRNSLLSRIQVPTHADSVEIKCESMDRAGLLSPRYGTGGSSKLSGILGL
jgi:hypothetical protein